ncbi:hypothetical protein AB1Y20_016585 [Prymnesium parvum]|uniref:EF-hand domain-containing protein n=1 Tax=Prymnesium parvum TaxID=97485 RepID=A0AB34IBS7_PRYPA
MLFPGRPEMLGTVASLKAPDASQILDCVRRDVFRGRVRLGEFFADFDPLRCGFVSEPKFRTAMEGAGLRLSEPELSTLALRYAEDPRAEQRRVRYKEFVADVDVIFTETGMETNPMAVTRDFTTQLAYQSPKLSDQEELACQALIEKLSHQVRVRQLLVKQVYSDYEKNVNSPIQVDQVTQAQFRNGLSQLGIQVTGEEAVLLIKKFAGRTEGFVNYVAFACAIDETERTFSSREPRSYITQPLTGGFRHPRLEPDGLSDSQPGRPPTAYDEPKYPPRSSAGEESTLDKVMRRLRDKAHHGRLRLSEFFRDFDKHHDGTVTEMQFIKALSVAYDKRGLALSEKELALLADKYAKQMVHGARHIQWRLFVQDVESPALTTSMEKNPLLTTRPRTPTQQVITLEPDAERRVQQLLADLRRRVEVRRVLVKPLFADYGDWSHSTKVVDHITRQQMVQSFSKFGVELTPDQQTLLFRRYDTLGVGTVNYVALVRDIDSFESFSSREVKHHAFPQDPDYGSTHTMSGGFWKERVVAGPVLNLQPGRPPTSNDQPRRNASPDLALPELLARLQRAAVQHRLRVGDHFKDFDRHRDGTVTVPQFHSAVAMTWAKHSPLSQAEMETLVRRYCVEKGSTVHVDWKAFVSDVNRIFTIDALERTPTAQAPPHPPNLPHGVKDLTPAEEADVARVLARLRAHCSTRRILVKPFFQDAEYHRRSMRVVDHVTRSQFEQCVSRLGLELNAYEYNLVERKFDDHNDGMVNYVQFACAIDKEELSSNRADSSRAGVLDLFKTNVNFKTEKVVEEQPGRPPTACNFPSILSNRPSDKLDRLLERLQLKALQYTISVRDFLADYDKHQIGAISRAQFRRGLSFAFGESYVHESITEEEVELLEETFKKEMIDGAQYVDWRAFSRKVDEARLTSNMEVQPRTHPSLRLIERKLPTLSDEEEARLKVLLDNMATRFRTRSVYVKAPFHDFAKSSNSPMMVDHITRSQLVQGLSRLGVELKEADMALLFKKYDDLGERSVNYVAFCRDVDATETFSDRTNVTMKDSLFGGFRHPKVHEDLLRTLC